MATTHLHKKEHSSLSRQNISAGGKSAPAVPVFQMQQNLEEDVSQMKISPSYPTKKETEQLYQLKPSQPLIPKASNNTGLPDKLKTGIESMSGLSMDDVKVHYNSEKPMQLQAFAYAQGTEIHIGPGQEQHLPHEAWHIVQQKQGRVQPTIQMKNGININADEALEHEADVMGAKAIQLQSMDSVHKNGMKNSPLTEVIQRSLIAGATEVKKGARHNFHSDLIKYLGVENGDARCHLVPFGNIRTIVMNQINSGLTIKSAQDVDNDLKSLLSAIFPNGPTATNHNQHQHHKQLEAIAHDCYEMANKSISAITKTLDGDKNIAKLASQGTDLINALNNSPDNLRTGHGGTNSSISDALDIPNDKINSITLDVNTILVDDDYKPYDKLKKPMKVLNPTAEICNIILDLLDSSEVGFVLKLYSSAHQIQTSDIKAMKTATMVDTNVQPVAIELATGWYLFRTS